MFSSKIKLRHFIEQVAQASTHFEEHNPAEAAALSTAIDAWEGKHDDSDQDELLHLGFLVCELLTHTIDHWKDREDTALSEIEDLRADLDEAESRASELEDKIDEIKAILN